uniref:Uncharacterized protein n=1 Tax=Zosterops lateralis melanops TaxID=1220523 RepID=A0A8D2PQQ1_ZOSLA
ARPWDTPSATPSPEASVEAAAPRPPGPISLTRSLRLLRLSRSSSSRVLASTRLKNSWSVPRTRLTSSCVRASVRCSSNAGLPMVWPKPAQQGC